MLVVVGLVRRVTVPPMQVVDVVVMGDDRMPAVSGVDVHMCAVRQMRLVDWLFAIRQLIDVVGAGPVHVAVVQVVDMVLMWDRGVATPLVVDMSMVIDRRVDGVR